MDLEVLEAVGHFQQREGFRTSRRWHHCLPEQLYAEGQVPAVLDVAGSRVRFWTAAGAVWKYDRGDQAAARAGKTVATRPSAAIDFIVELICFWGRYYDTREPNPAIAGKKD